MRSIGKNQSKHLEANSVLFFRRFLSLKIASPFLFSQGLTIPLDLTSILLFMFMLISCLRKNYLPGLLVILGLSFYDCYRSWPFTINHVYLECIMLLLMVLNPTPTVEETDSKRRYLYSSMIKNIMISVWIFSGIHKLLNGYYLNGEFFALEILHPDPATLGRNLNQLLDFLNPVPTAYGGTLDCCTHGSLNIPYWKSAVLLGMSWLTIATELFLPITVYFKKTKNLGLLGLFLFQGFIAYFSGEIDFAFTAFGVLLLFLPKAAPLNFTLLSILFLMVQPWH